MYESLSCLSKRVLCVAYNILFNFNIFNACKWIAFRKKLPKMVDLYVHLNRDGHYAWPITFKA